MKILPLLFVLCFFSFGWVKSTHSLFPTEKSTTREACAHTATWGFFGHKKINEVAVYALPPGLFGFYKQNLTYIIDHSVDPDKRRYGVKGEAPRHYIDIDHYGKNAFDSMPRRWGDAVEKYSEDTLLAYGIVPWHIQNMYYRLVKAFENKDKARILRTSAEIGHYLADAHVPLHTTKNYNGQFSGQYGIHGFWESRLPELFHETYDFLIPPAQEIGGPLYYAWDIVEDSHTALDSVLSFERILNEKFDSDKKYSYEERGVTLTEVYSKNYSTAYHNMLNGQVERRMRAACHAVSSYWYTAWLNAGEPDMAAMMAGGPVEVPPIIVTDSLEVKPDTPPRVHE